MIRIGILGAGAHSLLHHGPALDRLKRERPERLELSAVCDLKADKARGYAARFGFARTYDGIDAMLAREKLDGLVMVTPHTRTFEIVSPMLPKGLPLLIEKPPGLEVGQTESLLALAERHGTPHMISFNRRFDPAVMRARAWLAEHAQGRPILQAVARMLRVERREQRFIADTGIHLVDTVLSFMPPAVRVECRRWDSALGGQGADGRVAFQSGASAALIFAPDSAVREETYEFLGSDYSVQIDAFRHAVRVHHGGTLALDWQAPAGWPPYEAEGALAETERFLRAIEGAEPFWPTLSDGLASMRVAHALHRGGKHDIADG